MKALTVSLLTFLMACPIVYGQTDNKKGAPNLKGFDEKPLHFGFLLGLNTMDFRVYNSGAATAENNQTPIYAEVLKLQPGINIGIVSNLRLRKYLDLRFLPGISFGQRDLSYITKNGDKVEETPLQIKSTFLEFPLLLKYSSARQHNFKPYLVGGVNGRIDLAKSKKDKVVLKPMDVYLELGVGIDMYLNYFRFSTEIKGSHGLFNVYNPKGTGETSDIKYNQAIDKLTSNIFHLTFYFE
ncbi:MAG: porin family protein [Breznakibacter sp.]